MSIANENQTKSIRNVVEHDGVRYVVSTTNNRGWETAIFPAKSNGEPDTTNEPMFMDYYTDEDEAQNNHVAIVKSWRPIWLER